MNALVAGASGLEPNLNHPLLCGLEGRAASIFFFPLCLCMYQKLRVLVAGRIGFKTSNPNSPLPSCLQGAWWDAPISFFTVSISLPLHMQDGVGVVV